jgi:phosphate transport system substrate-binding protein
VHTTHRLLLTGLVWGVLSVLSAHGQTLRIDVAAAGRTLMGVAATEYQKAHTSARIELGVAGSAGSLVKLCNKEADLVVVSRPIQKPELALCKGKEVEFVEVPVAFDAVTVVVNSKNGFVSSLSLDELHTMWEAAAQGRITRWSQVNARFPDAPLKLLGPDAQFERNNTFTEAVLGPGQPARSDYMVSVDDSVLIQGVVRDPNTLGYVSLAYYRTHRSQLKAVPIAAKAGATPIEPTPENVAKGLYRPFARPLFLYVSAEALGTAPVREFVEFTLANGTRLAQAAKLVPLTDATYQHGLTRLRAGAKGTVWSGAMPLGLTVEELHRRNAL